MLQSRDTTGGFEPINPQAQLRPDQPVKRRERLVIDYRRNTYDQRVIVLIRYGYCAEPPGLPTEQCGDAGAAIFGERRVVMVRLHGQMVTPASIDPGIE